jgi:hypothetical protein
MPSPGGPGVSDLTRACRMPLAVTVAVARRKPEGGAPSESAALLSDGWSRVGFIVGSHALRVLLPASAPCRRIRPGSILPVVAVRPQNESAMVGAVTSDSERVFAGGEEARVPQ